MVSGKTKQVEQQGGLISYLAKLGLGDADLARVFSMLQPNPVESAPPAPQQEGLEQDFSLKPTVKPTVDPGEVFPDDSSPEDRSEWSIGEPDFEIIEPVRKSAVPGQKTVTIFLAEEQQILKDAYLSFFNGHQEIEVLGSSDDTSAESLVAAAKAFKPQAMLLGVKNVQKETVEKLDMLRQACPGVGVVLLFAFYDVQGIKALREFSKDTSSGCAYLLKHTVDTVEQLTQVIFSVVEGRIIIDPMVMEGLIKTGDANNNFLRELSPRELEVLSWMAKGYRNDTIADVLSRDVKTIERHINNIYSKLSSERQDSQEESRHPRVQAALTYLKATGLLPAEQFADD